MRPSNVQIVSVSGSASFTSTAIYAWDIVRAAFQVIVSSGSYSATVKFQGSNEVAVGLPINQYQPTYWTDLPDSLASITCSTTATTRAFLSAPVELSYQYIRVVSVVNPNNNGLVSVVLKSMAL